MMDVVHGCEQSLGIDKTIVMGDFNANPYDEELLLPGAFNAMLFKGILRARGSRTWHGKSYPFMPANDLIGAWARARGPSNRMVQPPSVFCLASFRFGSYRKR